MEVVSSRFPPFPGDLLVARNHQIPAWSRGQIARNGRLQIQTRLHLLILAGFTRTNSSSSGDSRNSAGSVGCVRPAHGSMALDSTVPRPPAGGGQAEEGLAKFPISASRRLNSFCMFNKTRQPHFCRSQFLCQTANFASPSEACPTFPGVRDTEVKIMPPGASPSNPQTAH